MDNILNSITGREKYLIRGNNVLNAITGAVFGVIEDGVVKSPTTGKTVALLTEGGGSGSVDLSFITAESGDILKGKIGADRNGNPVYGTLQTGGGGIEFYECASYTPDADAHTKYTFTLSGAPDELANGTYVRSKYVENIGDDVDYTTASVWKNDNGYSFVEEYETGEWRYYIKNSTGDYIYGIDSPMSRVTDFNSEYWVDWNSWESVPLVFSAWKTEEVPATTEGWTGRKVTQGDDGAWTVAEEITTGLTVTYLTPVVGEIFSADTSIGVRRMYDGTSWDYAVYIPLEKDASTAETGQSITKIGNPLFSVSDGVDCVKMDGESGIYISDSAVDVAGDFTVCFKVNYEHLHDGVLFQIGTASNHDLLIMNNTSGNSWTIGTAAGSGTFNILTDIEANQWYDIVLVRADGIIKIYQNGVLLGSEEWGITINPRGEVSVGCGYYNGNYTWYFSGYMSKFMVFNRALSDDEIKKVLV